MLLLLVCWLLFAAACGGSADPVATTVNISCAVLPNLSNALGKCGLTVAAGVPGTPASGQILLWEASSSADITPEIASQLDAYVRTGGSLWLTLGRSPGVGPMRLATILPTVAWETQLPVVHPGFVSGPIKASKWDHSFFGAAEPGSVDLSYYYMIRPCSAVERGEARYERYDRVIPLVDVPTKPGDCFWTRPLINRDWQAHVWGDDVGHTPILVTGRYGAGRVAVLAGSMADLDKSAGGEAVDQAVVQWLLARDPMATSPAPDGVPKLTPVATVDVPSRCLRVTVSNPTAAALAVQVVARVETWEPALIGDQTQSITLPANGSRTVTVSLPTVDSTSYQALDARDAYQARVGVLSASGDKLLGETSVLADLAPAVSVSVATDNLRSVSPSFPEPGPALQEPRMGLPIFGYAYSPGATVNATVTVCNSVCNLAPLAVVRDETQPDNPSASALTDGNVAAGKKPIDGVQAYGNWTGTAGQENDLDFTFPQPVKIVSVTLVGNPGNTPNTPSGATVEADGKQVAALADLGQAFTAGLGEANLAFPTVTATNVRLRLAWSATMPDGKKRREPWLGEVMINGAPADQVATKSAQGEMTLYMADAMTGKSTPVGHRNVTVAPLSTVSESFPVTLPATARIGFYRLEARFASESARVPVLAIQPDHSLRPVAEARPDSAPSLGGFIVTRGFRNAFDLDTGTQDMQGAWETNDDLVWAFSHRLKQVGNSGRTQAARLYVADSDMRHYCTPWDSFVDGEEFFPLATPNIIAKMKKDPKWASSPLARLDFSDRWDTGPSVGSMYNWQDFIAFDGYLRSKGLDGLHGRTRAEIAREIDTKLSSYWQEWQLSRYVANMDAIRGGFAAEGKNVVLSAQGVPIVPIPYQDALAATIKGMSDDSTWGMADESIPLTTGRQMAYFAFNPVWKMSTLLQWGWNSGILNSGFHTPVGTTEPSRRHYYDRAWRGIIGMDGQYRSMHTFGYNSNGGEAYTMTQNDWQQWWRVQERHSLISPDAPLGLGIVLCTSSLNKPPGTAFSGGGMGGSPIEQEVMQVANVVRVLHEAGVSVSFSTNAAALQKWRGTAPLLLLNPSLLSDDETLAVGAAMRRGSPLAAFVGADPLPSGVRNLFGSGALRSIGSFHSRPILGNDHVLLIPCTFDSLSAEDGRTLAPLLNSTLDLPISYPDGTCGYGFGMDGNKFIEVEDWLEQGRNVAVRLRASAHASAAHAVELNDHRALAVSRDGKDWVISLPLRPGDGDVICVKESE
jgi:hypothetical protein